MNQSTAHVAGRLFISSKFRTTYVQYLKEVYTYLKISVVLCTGQKVREEWFNRTVPKPERNLNFFRQWEKCHKALLKKDLVFLSIISVPKIIGPDRQET